MSDLRIVFDLTGVWQAVLDARQRVHAALQLDELDLLIEAFSEVDSNLDLVVFVADSEFDAVGVDQCAEAFRALATCGYSVKAVTAELEPSFVFIDDRLFIFQFPVRVLQGNDPKNNEAYSRIIEVLKGESPVDIPFTLAGSNASASESDERDAKSKVRKRSRRPQRQADTPVLDELLGLLTEALAQEASEQTCLRRWSAFIRARDGYRCVKCGSSIQLQAHHICRKAFLREARYMTGNGITLCQGCHSEAHAGFNGRPDFDEPMDAQGGEKIETLANLYACLAESSSADGESNEEHYFLSDQVLAKFKMLQGFKWHDDIPGTPIEQAAAIWRACPQQLLKAVLQANMPEVFSSPRDPDSDDEIPGRAVLKWTLDLKDFDSSSEEECAAENLRSRLKAKMKKYRT